MHALSRLFAFVRCLALLCALVGAASPALAVNTAPTFVLSNGTVITHVVAGGSYGKSVTVQADGKIVVAGWCNDDVCVLRYNSDGSLDTSFSGDGIVTTDIATTMGVGKSSDWIGDFVLQTDGKILVTGYSTIANGSGAYFLTLLRYNADGSLDASFSGDGVVAIEGGSMNLFGHSIALQPDGKILVAGDAMARSGGSRGILLTRFNSDGSLDTSFSLNGISYQESSTDIQGLTLQADGKILVTGTANNGDNLASYLIMVRYNSDGSLDTNFSSDGMVTGVIGYNNTGGGVAVQVDGKILVAGSIGTAFALSRYNSDGSLDTSFSNSGIVTTAGFSGSRITLQLDGKILVTGSSDGGFSVLRYNIDGSLDASFSNDGKVILDFGPFSDSAFGIAVQRDGAIVVTGNAFIVVPEDTFNGGHNDLALVRYTPDGSLDLTLM